MSTGGIVGVNQASTLGGGLDANHSVMNVADLPLEGAHLPETIVLIVFSYLSAFSVFALYCIYWRLGQKWSTVALFSISIFGQQILWIVAFTNAACQTPLDPEGWLLTNSPFWNGVVLAAKYFLNTTAALITTWSVMLLFNAYRIDRNFLKRKVMALVGRTRRLSRSGASNPGSPRSKSLPESKSSSLSSSSDPEKAFAQSEQAHASTHRYSKQSLFSRQYSNMFSLEVHRLFWKLQSIDLVNWAKIACFILPIVQLGISYAPGLGAGWGKFIEVDFFILCNMLIGTCCLILTTVKIIKSRRRLNKVGKKASKKLAVDQEGTPKLVFVQPTPVMRPEPSLAGQVNGATGHDIDSFQATSNTQQPSPKVSRPKAVLKYFADIRRSSILSVHATSTSSPRQHAAIAMPASPVTDHYEAKQNRTPQSLGDLSLLARIISVLAVTLGLQTYIMYLDIRNLYNSGLIIHVLSTGETYERTSDLISHRWPPVCIGFLMLLAFGTTKDAMCIWLPPLRRLLPFFKIRDDILLKSYYRQHKATMPNYGDFNTSNTAHGGGSKTTSPRPSAHLSAGQNSGSPLPHQMHGLSSTGLGIVQMYGGDIVSARRASVQCSVSGRGEAGARQMRNMTNHYGITNSPHLTDIRRASVPSTVTYSDRSAPESAESLDLLGVRDTRKGLSPVSSNIESEVQR